MNDETFIASAQSPRQIKLIEGHPTKTPLFVEGGYNIWVREKCLTHFILRADATPENIEKKEEKKGLYSTCISIWKCRNHHFLIAMKSDCANHLKEIAFSRYSWEKSGGIIGLCIPSLPVIKIIFLC